MARGRTKVKRTLKLVDENITSYPERWIKDPPEPKEGERFIRIGSDGHTYTPQTKEARKLAMQLFAALIDYDTQLWIERQQSGQTH